MNNLKSEYVICQTCGQIVKFPSVHGHAEESLTGGSV